MSAAPDRVAEAGGFARNQLTLRDYFAAKAMQALLMPTMQAFDRDEAMEGVRSTALAAYAVADAMLKARTA